MTALSDFRRFRPSQRWIIPAAILLIILIVFGTQSGGIGFWKGSHGWNSAHALAIMTHAGPENLFVGYALADRTATGHTGYIYFDRYPFFFSAFINRVMSITDNLAHKVWLARQVMNLIFVATLAAAFALIRRLTGHSLLALSITLVTFAGYNFIYYRDMIHYDQPALLGMMLLLYVLAIYKLEQKRRWRWLYVIALVAVSLGRGYASFFVLGLWFAAEAGGLLLERTLSLRQRLTRILTHDAAWVLALALVWAGALLSYNIVVEALRRDVPIEHTSVIESARRRLPFGHEGGRNLTTASEDSPPPWDEFIALQSERLIRWFTPLNLGWDDGEIAAWASPAGALVLAVTAVYILRQPPRVRMIAFLTAAGCAAWLAFMINLTATHEYTIMYGAGLALIFYTAALAWLKRHRFAPALLLVISLTIFGYMHYRVYADNVDEIRSYDIYTEDYNRILHAIEGSQRSIYHTFPNNCAIENSKCFVLGFYLGDHFITPDYEAADYILTGHVYHTSKPFLMPDDADGLQLVSQSLTPANTVAHLFDATAAETRHIPETAETLFYFGNTFTLQHWELKDSVEVQPCQRVHIESWWQMVEPPLRNYSMQIALVNGAGEAVSSANGPLTTLPTRVWIAEAYFLDTRAVQVPCDAAPGEYPLVMSVYDPDSVAISGSLPVSLPDGTSSNDYVYLTTLFVR